eukprot:5055794-Lingulodinium_polyedra.AAC.1
MVLSSWSLMRLARSMAGRSVRRCSRGSPVISYSGHGVQPAVTYSCCTHGTWCGSAAQHDSMAFGSARLRSHSRLASLPPRHGLQSFPAHSPCRPQLDMAHPGP